jgi:diguanylate cyclase (GGDEF)-like protein
MRKRIGIYGASDEALHLIPVLEANPEVEVSVVYDPAPDAVRERLRSLPPELAGSVEPRLVGDPAALVRAPLHAVVDSGLEPSAAERLPELAGEGVQIVAPLTARLLYGYGVSARDRKQELLQALHEVVESYNLTVDTDELFSRMLEIAIGVTGADRGSLMLLDPATRELRVRVAVGIEPELWAKIRVPLGEGIAGRVAAEARPVRLRGRADQQSFRTLRERGDVESAISAPLVHEGVVLGVLNLHHTTQPDAFSETDLSFVEQLAALDAQIIARAQEHEVLRQQATRYAAVREVREVLSRRVPLLERLSSLCQALAQRGGGGVATVYLRDAEGAGLRLAATSLTGGGLGGDYRVAPGEGLEGRVAAERRSIVLRSGEGAILYASLPLLSGDELLGVLSLQGGRSAPRDRAAEETLLEIAAAAADEIAQAEREARMSSRATKVSAINETGIRMISARDTSEVVRLATSSAAMVLEADHALLRLQDEETRRYVIRSYFGSADGRLQEKLFRLDQRVSVEAIKRRTAFLERDLSHREDWSQAGTGVRSLLAAPLKHDGRVIGTLVLYDKVAPEHFFAGAFSDDDLQMFAKFVSYVERAVESARLVALARQHRSFDEETGLPNAAYLSQRVEEEIARLSERGGNLCVLVCRIENFEALRRVDAERQRPRAVRRAADALRRALRPFDVVARTGDAEFTALLPDPGRNPDERVAAAARAVAEDVAKDDPANDPVRLALGFGFAVYPGDGRTRDELLARAAVPRIRTV